MREPINEFMCFYGVGNHGGGPTKENLASIHRLNNDPDYPKVVFSTPEAFFKSVEGKSWPLPIGCLGTKPSPRALRKGAFAFVIQCA